MSLCLSSRTDKKRENYPKEKVIVEWWNKAYWLFQIMRTHTSIGVCLCVCTGLYVNLHRPKSHVKTCQSFPVKWVELNSGCSRLCCVLACGWTLDRLSGADGIWVQALESCSFLWLIHHSILYYQTGNRNTQLMGRTGGDLWLLCLWTRSNVMCEV